MDQILVKAMNDNIYLYIFLFIDIDICDIMIVKCDHYLFVDGSHSLE